MNCIEDTLYATTETGTKLFINSYTKNSEKYAKGIKLNNVKVFLTHHKNGEKVYVIFKKNIPVYESSSYESIGCHLDIMKMLKERKV
jgi:hypothetical protein